MLLFRAHRAYANTPATGVAVIRVGDIVVLVVNILEQLSSFFKPFCTAVPFWGRVTWNLSPTDYPAQCSTERVKARLLSPIEVVLDFTRLGQGKYY